MPSIIDASSFMFGTHPEQPITVASGGEVIDFLDGGHAGPVAAHHPVAFAPSHDGDIDFMFGVNQEHCTAPKSDELMLNLLVDRV
jgi:hypothetical protein